MLSAAEQCLQCIYVTVKGSTCDHRARMKHAEDGSALVEDRASRHAIVGIRAQHPTGNFVSVKALSGKQIVLVPGH